MPDARPKIILASASPRRSELLSAIGVTFEVAPSSIHESPGEREPPGDYIMRLARAKVMEVGCARESGLVIGADTVVVVDGEVLGKPEDQNHARRMLRLLSGRWHEVMTAVALYDVAARRLVFDDDKTRVRFAELNENEIEWYIKTGEPFDKAGSYAIQGRGALFVLKIVGNYHNVVGLPIPLIYRLAGELGYSLLVE